MGSGRGAARLGEGRERGSVWFRGRGCGDMGRESVWFRGRVCGDMGRGGT